MSVKKILPHPKVQVKEWDADGYPSSIIVEMSNNTTAVFDRRIEQPAPYIITGERLAKLAADCTYGYAKK